MACHAAHLPFSCSVGSLPIGFSCTAFLLILLFFLDVLLESLRPLHVLFYLQVYHLFLFLVFFIFENEHEKL